MKLEDIVPPVELCKKIPDGAFADSALVWRGPVRRDLMAVIERTQIAYSDYDLVKEGVRFIFPAPTLDEILTALARLEVCPRLDMVENIKGEICGCFSADRHVIVLNGKDKLATSALKLWLKVKGINHD